MDLPLHQWCSVDEAVAALGDGAAGEAWCDGQFVVLPKVVLCCITLDGTADGSHLPDSLHVVWRPPRRDYAPGEEWPWFPEVVRELYDRSGADLVRLKDHHVLLRSRADERFLYAGLAYLSKYGRNGEALSARFSLRARVPREAWLRFGGYLGWQVTVNDESRLVDAGDTEALHALADRLAEQELSSLSLTRYEGDVLIVRTNARRASLMYLRVDPGSYSGACAEDRGYAGDPSAEEIFACDCGIDLTFPAGQTVPRSLAAPAAAEFFLTGQLPTCVDWDIGE